MTEYRIATLEERKEFYQNEFDIDKLLAWFKFKPQFLAIDCGSESGVIKFPDRKDKIIVLPPNLPKEELKRRFVVYLPEDIYYDRNVYDDETVWFKQNQFRKFWGMPGFAGQQLCFDVDVENIRDADHNNKDDYTSAVKEAAAQTLEVADVLRNQWNFQDIGFVYSGRGFHVQIYDKESFKLKVSERNAINDSLTKFAIDKWVSGGASRLMRLPFSLHGLVSRVVTPLEEKELGTFDPSKDGRTLPQFLSH